MSNQTKEFTEMVSRLERMAATITDKAATVAINFSKERFRQQNWNGIPWKKRNPDPDPGRAVLVGKGTGNLKRDIHKIEVTPSKAIIGTSNITSPYAKAHNEGFQGTVIVPAHTRKRYAKVKESYTDRNGRNRTRTSKQLDATKGDIEVKAHYRKMKLAQRRFLGASPLLDAELQNMITNEILKAIHG